MKPECPDCILYRSWICNGDAKDKACILNLTDEDYEDIKESVK